MSLRAILSGSRVTKRSSPVKKKRPAARSSSLAGSPSSSSPKKAKKTKDVIDDNEDDDDVDDDNNDDGDLFFEDEDATADPLDDTGLIASLADDVSLRDVVQALRYARDNMFDPIPSSGRLVVAAARLPFLRHARLIVPPMTTTAHIAAILPNATATERETVALLQTGALLKIVQPGTVSGEDARRRNRGSSEGNSSGTGGISGAEHARLSASLREVLVETAAYKDLVRKEGVWLSPETKQTFSAFLDRSDNNNNNNTDGNVEGNRQYTINGRPSSLTTAMADELVHAGFLVGHGAVRGLSVAPRPDGRAATSLYTSADTGDVFTRPEDRTTLLSLETVAKAASGSYAAVGGVGAVYAAGGGGARAPSSQGRQQQLQQQKTSASRGTILREDLLLAVPGHGRFVKVAAAGLAHLVALLSKTPYREAVLSTLRERWDGGGSGRRRGGVLGFKKVPPARSKKWKEFSGLSFDWILAEAIGAGLVELFDTGSVGRGVRLVT